MKVDEVREKFLKFMLQKKHTVINSSSLLPKEDSTTLFIGSGMQPIVPYLSGREVHPLGNRLANSQKCFRANDIDEVGDNRHTTFFEMLGNWALGDYFKEEQIKNCFEFLTDKNVGLGLDPNKFYVTVFSGDDKYKLERDNESVEIWKKLFEEKGVKTGVKYIGDPQEGDKIGMEEGERIFFYDSSKNWWSRSGVPEAMPESEIGGPDTEVFYDFGEEYTHRDYKHLKPHPNSDSGRFVEICNSVFIQYKKTGGGFELLSQKNVDFGGGLERLTSAVNNNPDIFSLDVFCDVIKEIGDSYAENAIDYRIVADHLRASLFLASDGVVPSNTDRGYILRRLIRKMIHSLRHVLQSQADINSLLNIFIDKYKNVYPEVNNEAVKRVIQEEIVKFEKTLKNGMKIFNNLLDKGDLNEKNAFVLQSSYGFPFELTSELANNNDIVLEKELFNMELEKHKLLSNKNKDVRFKGGLASQGVVETKYHTTTHLLHQALIDVLGGTKQRGSNITDERIRFDFEYPQKLTEEQKTKVEDVVNRQIERDLKIRCETMNKEDAEKLGAIGLFGEKYEDKVKVYFIGDYSREFCNGPHVERTGVLGRFVIVKETSVAGGVRRIKAVLK